MAGLSGLLGIGKGPLAGLGLEAGGGILSNVAQGIGQTKMLREQAKTNKELQDILAKRSGEIEGTYSQAFDPYSEVGRGALSELKDFSFRETGPYEAQEFSFDPSADPSYQFRLEQGLAPITQEASGMGRLFSGETAKGLQDYASDFASQEYGKAYDRFADEEAARRGQFNIERQYQQGLDQADLNRIKGLSDMGFQADTTRAGGLSDLQRDFLDKNLELTGLEGEIRSQRAGVPYGTAANIFGNASTAGGNYMDYKMGTT